MYVETSDFDTIPEAETLSLTDLPNQVHWPKMAADPAKSNHSPLRQQFFDSNACSHWLNRGHMDS